MLLASTAPRDYGSMLERTGRESSIVNALVTMSTAIHIVNALTLRHCPPE